MKTYATVKALHQLYVEIDASDSAAQGAATALATRVLAAAAEQVPVSGREAFVAKVARTAASESSPAFGAFVGGLWRSLAAGAVGPVGRPLPPPPIDPGPPQASWLRRLDPAGRLADALVAAPDLAPPDLAPAVARDLRRLIRGRLTAPPPLEQQVEALCLAAVARLRARDLSTAAVDRAVGWLTRGQAAERALGAVVQELFLLLHPADAAATGDDGHLHDAAAAAADDRPLNLLTGHTPQLFDALDARPERARVLSAHLLARWPAVAVAMRERREAAWLCSLELDVARRVAADVHAAPYEVHVDAAVAAASALATAAAELREAARLWCLLRRLFADRAATIAPDLPALRQEAEMARLQRRLARTPGDAADLWQRACLHAQRGAPREALADLAALPAEQAEWPQVLLLRARMHSLAGDWPAAMQDAVAGASGQGVPAPLRAELWAEVGRGRLAAGDAVAAWSAARQAAALDPGSAAIGALQDDADAAEGAAWEATLAAAAAGAPLPVALALARHLLQGEDRAGFTRAIDLLAPLHVADATGPVQAYLAAAQELERFLDRLPAWCESVEAPASRSASASASAPARASAPSV